MFNNLLILCQEILDGVKVEGCGVGSAGPMSHNGEEISPLNIPQWRNFPLRSKLSERLGLPVALDNDAKAVALGEGWVGAASKERNYLAMMVSTGIGGGLVLDGRLLDGADGNAGHIGHITVDEDGPKCDCGSYGCLEAVASGRSIEKETGFTRLGNVHSQFIPRFYAVRNCDIDGTTKRIDPITIKRVAKADHTIALVGLNRRFGGRTCHFDIKRRELNE